VAGTLADEYLPAYDVVMRHAVRVRAPAPAVWAALHRADFAGAWYVRALLALRGLRSPRRVDRLTLDRLVRGGFIPLGERAGREVALGLVGRFWLPSGGRVTSTADEFKRFARPAHAKVVWTFAVEVARRHTVKFVIDRRKKLVQNAVVPLSPLYQHSGHILGFHLRLP